MKLKNLSRIIGGCMLLFAAQAHSQNDDNYPFYGGFALGFSESDEDCDYYYYDYDCDGDDTGFKVYGGKRFHENLAFEISFQDLGKLDNEQGPITTTAESSGLNFSLHGIIPVSEIGYFYGKAGFMAWETDYTRVDATTTTSDDDGTDFTFGVGFAFAFAEKYEFRVEYERLNELDDDFTPGGSYITMFSFGGAIKFE